MKKSPQPLSPGNFRGWSAAAAHSSSASDELYRRMMAEASAAANASLKKVKEAEDEEMQIQAAAAAKPGTFIRRAAPARTQLALPRMHLPAFLEEEEAAEAAAAADAANVGLRLNLKRAGIPSTFNNNANFSEYTENPPLGVHFNRQKSINEAKRKEAAAAEMAREARMSPLGRLASMQYAYAEQAKQVHGHNAVRMGLAPLPLTPGSMPPPRMYVPGQEVPGTSKKGASILMNNEGGRRRSRRTKRRTNKRRRN